METCQDFIKRKNKEYQKQKLIPMKDIGRQGKHVWIREAWTFMPQTGLKEKVFVFERLKRAKIEGKATHAESVQVGDIEYRIGYYMVGKNGRANGRWIWGQFCPMVPKDDFKKLIDLAKKDEVII